MSRHPDLGPLVERGAPIAKRRRVPALSEMPYSRDPTFRMHQGHHGPGDPWKPNALQLELIEWLLDPERPEKSLVEWAEKRGVSVHQARRWKKGEGFRKLWEARAAELNGGPDRVQNIVNAMYKKAMDGDVKAMQLYLTYVERFTPTRKVITEDRSVKEMSDEQLAEALGKNITPLRKEA